MTEREQSLGTEQGPSLDPEEQSLLEGWFEAGRRERAPVGLSERIADHVEYRSRLDRGPRSAIPSRAHSAVLPALCLITTLAAAALVARSRVSEPSIGAELARSATAESPSKAPASTVFAKASRVDACVGRPVAAGSASLIDDFEDGDDAIAQLEQRTGLWRWVRETDAPGTAPALLPIPRSDGTARNRLALHVKGGRLVDWGAAIEFNFNPSCYDASTYSGITFRAHGPGRIYVAPRQTSVIPVNEGGSCDGDCHNPHVSKIDLDAEWRVYKVRWSDVRQRGFDKPALDPSRLHSVAFLVRPEDTPYDVWLDDVRFLSP